MGSLGTWLHQDCNPIGDSAKISALVPCTLCSRSVGRRWVDMILPGREDPHNCVDPWKERVIPEVGNVRVCILIVWQDEMKMRSCLSTPGSPEYILHVAHCTSVYPLSPYTHHHSFHLRYPCISVHPTSLLNDILGASGRSSVEMHWEAVIQWVWRYTWRPWSIGFGNALGCRDRVNSEMHLQAVIKRVWRCTGRPRGGERREALGGCDLSSLEMHLEAVTERVWRGTCRLCSSEIGRVLRGGQFGGWRNGSWDSIQWLTCNCGNVESSVQHPQSDEKLASSGTLLSLGWCSTWCMLYSVFTRDYCMER